MRKKEEGQHLVRDAATRQKQEKAREKDLEEGVEEVVLDDTLVETSDGETDAPNNESEEKAADEAAAGKKAVAVSEGREAEEVRRDVAAFAAELRAVKEEEEEKRRRFEEEEENERRRAERLEMEKEERLRQAEAASLRRQREEEKDRETEAEVPKRVGQRQADDETMATRTQPHTKKVIKRPPIIDPGIKRRLGKFLGLFGIRKPERNYWEPPETLRLPSNKRGDSDLNIDTGSADRAEPIDQGSRF